MPSPQPDALPSPIPQASVVFSNTEVNAASGTPPSDSVELPKFAPPTQPGELGRLGKYRIQKELGRGGMGAVYLAFDERLQRRIALKVMLPKAAANLSAKERFLREARAAAQISSDFVVSIHEADEIDGIPYIALQYLQGCPLDDYLVKQGNPSIPQVIRIGYEAALGLAAAHQLGLVHRDIKPANIWLESPNGRVKILDFGLALQQDNATHLTTTGLVVGTPAYMSPEQGRGLPMDGRSDLFSLGAVLYRLCTGQMPFKGDTAMALLMSIGMDEPTPIQELNPKVPQPLAKLIHRLLGKSPADRPRSAKIVAEELNAMFAQSQTPTALSTSQPQVIYVPMAIQVHEPNPFAEITEVSSSVSEPVVESPSSAQPEAIPAKPFPTKLVAGVLVGIAAVVLAILLIANNKKPNTDTAGKGTEPQPTPNPTPKNTGKGTDPQPQPTMTPDRRAAEYAVKIGGTIRINDEVRDIRTDAELPREAFRLTFVGFAGNKQVNDAGLLAFKECKNLAYLDLRDTQVSDAGIAHFKDCKNLSELKVGGTQVGDTGIAHFKDCKNLTVLWAQNTKLGDAGLAQLKNCKNLVSLNLFGAQVGDMGLEILRDLKSLTTLDLAGTNVSDAALVKIKDCSNLTSLWLQNTRVSDLSLGHLFGLKSLTKLNLRSTKVTAEGVKKLAATLPQCRIDWDGGPIEPSVIIDPERRAAEYALSVGGSVWVNDQAREIKLAAELPAGGFQLTSVTISEASNATDAGLAAFKDCSNIKKLFITGSRNPDARITDAGLMHFRNCTNLEDLRLTQTRLTDAGLNFFSECKKIKNFTLNRTQLTDAGVSAFFKGRTNVERLDLSATGVTDVGLAVFKDFRNLTDIHLSDTNVTDAGVAVFKDCTMLRMLVLSSTQFTDKGLASLANCKKLETLWIGNTLITDEGLALLKAHDKLIHLALHKCKVTRLGVEAFSKAMPQCKIDWDGGLIQPMPKVANDRRAAEWVVSAGGTVKINGEEQGIVNAADLPAGDFRVTTVFLREHPQFTDEGLAAFKDCRHVIHLILNSRAVTDAGLAHFRNCKELASVSLTNAAITDEGLAVLKDCSKLTILNLAGTRVTDAGFVHFKDCKQLAVLDLGHTQGVTGAGFVHLKDCKNLSTLNVNASRATDEGLSHFKDCKNLTTLILSNTQIGDAGLAHFKGCKNVTHVLLAGTKITDAGLAVLKDCSKLIELDLQNTPVTDAGIKVFSGHTMLTTLRLQKTKVTAAGMESLQKALPQCRLEWDGGTILPQK